VHTSRYTVGIALAALLFAAAQAAAPNSRITMLLTSGRSMKTFAVNSVSFDRTKIGRGKLHGPQPTEAGQITIVMPADAQTEKIFKANTALSKVDLLLYVKDPAGKQHLRSQVEIGKSTVTEYKPSSDKKTATVTIASKVVYVTEPALTGNPDWVSSKA